jgi:hypothetical protein
MRLLTLEVSTTRRKRQGRSESRPRSPESGNKTAAAVKMLSRPWRLRFREVIREVEEGVAVRFPSSAGRAAVHGVGGDHRKLREKPLSTHRRKEMEVAARRGRSELGFLGLLLAS